jgi:hypothetical protein
MNYNFMQQAYARTIEWAIKRLAIDTNRIYLTGSSAGACGGFVFTLTYPERFAAVSLSVPCFNLGFQQDSVHSNSLNPGQRNRMDVDRLLGTLSMNLPSNLGLPTFNLLNGAWMAHQFREKNFPFIFAINGKNDSVVGWTEKHIYYDSVNANHLGGAYYWDSRNHGGTGAVWSSKNFNFLRFQRNVSYPAFANCSLNENYGLGSKLSGEAFGTVNGAMDWSDNIIDDSEKWQIDFFIHNIQGLTLLKVYPDSATVDITPRRLQHFTIPVGARVTWQVVHHDQIVQRDSFIYEGGLITAHHVKAYHDTAQFQISFKVQQPYYADVDADGYGNENVSLTDFSPIAGYVSDHSDCNDLDAAIHPDQSDLCNHLDDDCDGTVDENATFTSWYLDADGDTYGDALTLVTSCDTIPAGYITDEGDCNDSDPLVNPLGMENCNGIDDNCNNQVDEGLLQAFYPDLDLDGFGDESSGIMACSEPAGYITDHGDCNDNDGLTNPSAMEVCNGIDDNCNTQTDEGLLTAFYPDSDLDGFGDQSAGTMACTVPGGYITDSSDCNDHDFLINPAELESCNGIDDNCNSSIDEGVQVVFYSDVDGDGYGDVNVTEMSCTAPPGYVSDNTDCNDGPGYSGINPGALETCNGLDDNCNSQVDESAITTYYFDNDADGYGSLPDSIIGGCTVPSGYSLNHLDCDDNNPNTWLISSYYADADSDGYGNLSAVIYSCSEIAPPGFVAESTDCNDASENIHPGGMELCNGTDDNCDGQIDEGIKSTFYADVDGDGFGDIGNTTLACFAPPGYVLNSNDCNDDPAGGFIHPNTTETCNGVDDNCDGQIDEGVKSTFYADADGDGFGDAGNSMLACFAPTGYVIDGTDCSDSPGSELINPNGMETCNNLDDNCNGQIDEGVKSTFYADVDGDGFGDEGNSVLSCGEPNGYTSDSTDCNDSPNAAAINKNAMETCNGVDDNCDGQTDEGVKTIFYADVDGDGFGDAGNTMLSCASLFPGML